MVCWVSGHQWKPTRQNLVLVSWNSITLQKLDDKIKKKKVEMRNILQKYRKQNEIKTWMWYIPLHSVSTVCSIKCKTVECYFSGDNTIFGGSWNGSMAFPLLLRGKDDLRSCTSGVLIDKRGTIVSGFCRHWSWNLTFKHKSLPSPAVSTSYERIFAQK